MFNLNSRHNSQVVFEKGGKCRAIKLQPSMALKNKISKNGQWILTKYDDIDFNCKSPLSSA